MASEPAKIVAPFGVGESEKLDVEFPRNLAEEVIDPHGAPVGERIRKVGRKHRNAAALGQELELPNIEPRGVKELAGEGGRYNGVRAVFVTFLNVSVAPAFVRTRGGLMPSSLFHSSRRPAVTTL